jgi:3-carboxy-cis,cis-muconate cycloisomerase
LVGDDAARFVHFGATSQDVVDTAAMLVAKRALALVLADTDGVAAACAELARSYRTTAAAGRTLLQQAVPITFGLRAASWLVLVLDARRSLRGVELAAQLGGAAGTLAPLGEHGPEVLRHYAAALELVEPTLAWHANRSRVAELGGALDLAAGTFAKIALDVALLSQPEVAEVAEGEGGGSSTMPQKRNPVGSTLARACAALARAQAQVLAAGVGQQELERAAGAWHAEWDALSGALAYAGGAAAAVRGVVEGLEVDAERMERNLYETVLAERLAFLLAERHGREAAHELLAKAAASGRPLREALAGELPDEELDEALDPTTYLGSAGAFVDRALTRYEEES